MDVVLYAIYKIQMDTVPNSIFADMVINFWLECFPFVTSGWRFFVAQMRCTQQLVNGIGIIPWLKPGASQFLTPKKAKISFFG